MAIISKKLYVPGYRHLRSDPTMQAIHFRKGEMVRSEPGAAFWFRPLNSAVAEVPLDDRDQPFMFTGRTSDFQSVTVRGGITYRTSSADQLARRVDFAIDLDNGKWKQTPLEQLAGLISELAQQFVWDYLTKHPLNAVLTTGVEELRGAITGGLSQEPALTELGIQVIAVRVADIKPEHDVEDALQTPARERIQQQKDEAQFQRRANASEKERAVAEQEEQNRIELAKKQREVVNAQADTKKTQIERQAEAQNLTQRAQVEQENIRIAGEAEHRQKLAEASATESRIGAEAQAKTNEITSTARAAANRLEAAVEKERVEAVEGAKVEQEKVRMELYRNMDPRVLLALAIQEGNLPDIEHFTVTPDVLTQAISRFGNGS